MLSDEEDSASLPATFVVDISRLNSLRNKRILLREPLLNLDRLCIDDFIPPSPFTPSSTACLMLTQDSQSCREQPSSSESSLADFSASTSRRSSQSDQSSVSLMSFNTSDVQSDSVDSPVMEASNLALSHTTANCEGSFKSSLQLSPEIEVSVGTSELAGNDASITVFPPSRNGFPSVSVPLSAVVVSALNKKTPALGRKRGRPRKKTFSGGRGSKRKKSGEPEAQPSSPPIVKEPIRAVSVLNGLHANSTLDSDGGLSSLSAVQPKSAGSKSTKSGTESNRAPATQQQEGPGVQAITSTAVDPAYPNCSGAFQLAGCNPIETGTGSTPMEATTSTASVVNRVVDSSSTGLSTLPLEATDRLPAEIAETTSSVCSRSSCETSPEKERAFAYPHYKEGNQYRIEAMSGPPGCARLAAVSYISMNPDKKKLKKTRHKKHRADKSIKQEPMFSDHFESDVAGFSTGPSNGPAPEEMLAGGEEPQSGGLPRTDGDLPCGGVGGESESVVPKPVGDDSGAAVTDWGPSLPAATVSPSVAGFSGGGSETPLLHGTNPVLSTSVSPMFNSIQALIGDHDAALRVSQASNYVPSLPGLDCLFASPEAQQPSGSPPKMDFEDLISSIVIGNQSNPLEQNFNVEELRRSLPFDAAGIAQFGLMAGASPQLNTTGLLNPHPPLPTTFTGHPSQQGLCSCELLTPPSDIATGKCTLTAAAAAANATLERGSLVDPNDGPLVSSQATTHHPLLREQSEPGKMAEAPSSGRELDVASKKRRDRGPAQDATSTDSPEEGDSSLPPKKKWKFQHYTSEGKIERKNSKPRKSLPKKNKVLKAVETPTAGSSSNNNSKLEKAKGTGSSEGKPTGSSSRQEKTVVRPSCPDRPPPPSEQTSRAVDPASLTSGKEIRRVDRNDPEQVGQAGSSSTPCTDGAAKKNVVTAPAGSGKKGGRKGGKTLPGQSKLLLGNLSGSLPKASSRGAALSSSLKSPCTEEIQTGSDKCKPELPVEEADTPDTLTIASGYVHQKGSGSGNVLQKASGSEDVLKKASGSGDVLKKESGSGDVLKKRKIEPIMFKLEDIIQAQQNLLQPLQSQQQLNALPKEPILGRGQPSNLASFVFNLDVVKRRSSLSSPVKQPQQPLFKFQLSAGSRLGTETRPVVEEQTRSLLHETGKDEDHFSSEMPVESECKSSVSCGTNLTPLLSDAELSSYSPHTPDNPESMYSPHSPEEEEERQPEAERALPEEGELVDIHPLYLQDEDMSLLGGPAAPQRVENWSSRGGHPKAWKSGGPNSPWAPGIPGGGTQHAPRRAVLPSGGRGGARSGQPQGQRVSPSAAAVVGGVSGDRREGRQFPAQPAPPGRGSSNRTSPMAVSSQQNSNPFKTPTSSTAAAGLGASAGIPGKKDPPDYSRAGAVGQRTTDWVASLQNCPPPPPLPLPLQEDPFCSAQPGSGGGGGLEPDDDNDDDFVSASVVNGPPAKMASFSQQDGSRPGFSNWGGYCKQWLTKGVRCPPTCGFKHVDGDSLPSSVVEHLKNVDAVSHMVEVPPSQINDELAAFGMQLLRDLEISNCEVVWASLSVLKEKYSLCAGLQFHEQFLMAISKCSTMADHKCRLAQQTFEHLKRTRGHSLVEDFDFLLKCYSKNGNVSRGADVLQDMRSENVAPSKEALFALLDTMDDITVTTAPGQALLRAVLPKILHFVHLCGNNLLRIFLKQRLIFEGEILKIVDEIGLLDKFTIRVDQLVDVIDLCLIRDRHKALSKLLRHCHCIDLLPLQCVSTLFMAIAVRQVDVGLFGLFMQKVQGNHLKALTERVWNSVLETLCQSGHMRDMKQLLSFCRQNDVHISDKVLLNLVDAFLKGPDVHSAVECFCDLETVTTEMLSTLKIPSLCQTMVVHSDSENLFRVCRKLLQNGIAVKTCDLYPLFKMLLKDNNLKYLAGLCQLVLECPEAHLEIPLSVLKDCEERLRALEEHSALVHSLDQFFLAAMPHPLRLRMDTSSVSQMAQASLEAYMETEEWDFVALSLRKMEPFPVQLGEKLFTCLVNRMPVLKSFDKQITLFVGLLLKDVPPDASAAVTQLVGRMGVSLLVEAVGQQSWAAGFATLHQLHRHGVHYVVHPPYAAAPHGALFPSPCARMMACVLICVRHNPEAAMQVLRGCNWEQPGEGCARDLDLVREHVPLLLDKYLADGGGEPGLLDAAGEVLEHFALHLPEKGSEEYHSLLTCYMAAKEIGKAYTVCTLLVGELKVIRKNKLLEMLDCLHSFDPPSPDVLEQKRTLVSLSIETGVFSYVKGSAPFTLCLPKEVIPEEACLLVEHFVEELCLSGNSLSDVTVFFPSVDTMQSVMNQLLQYFTPRLLSSRVEANCQEPYLRLSQSSLGAWRRANFPETVPKPRWPSPPPPPMLVGSPPGPSRVVGTGDALCTEDGGGGKRDRATVKKWQQAWRSAVQKSLGRLVHQYRDSKFASRDDRHHFLKTMCVQFAKKIEQREKGPWTLTRSKHEELKTVALTVLKEITVYDRNLNLPLVP